MSEVQRFNCALMNGYAYMNPRENGLWVQSADYDAAKSELAASKNREMALLNSIETANAELAALREELAVANHEIESRISAEVGAIEALAAAEQRNAVRDIESAAKVLANCMDYPWEHMPENGRVLMRKHAQAVIDAALVQPTESGESE